MPVTESDVALMDDRVYILLALAFVACCACLAMWYYIRNDHKEETDEKT